jgi:hypothetical protein
VAVAGPLLRGRRIGPTGRQSRRGLRRLRSKDCGLIELRVSPAMEKVAPSVRLREFLAGKASE